MRFCYSIHCSILILSLLVSAVQSFVLFPLGEAATRRSSVSDDNSHNVVDPNLVVVAQTSPDEGFFDLEDDDLLMNEDEQEEQEKEELFQSELVSQREQADMLEEREDRLYVDDKGVKRQVERCILVGVEDLSLQRRKGGGFSLEESMKEMRELIKTAGMELVGEVTQRLNEINPKTYIGSGKVAEADELMKEMDACTIVFDAELFPGQQKALENTLNRQLLQNDFLGAEGEIKVVDRTALIF